MDNVFAKISDDPDVIIREVRRRAAEECLDEQLAADALDRCVHDAVTELWGSEVKTFVPLLALRRVRFCLQAGTCDCEEF